MATNPSDKLSDQLRAAGLSVTSQRIAVHQTVATHPHATADEVFTETKAAIGGISRQAVYDVLHALSEHGLLRRIQPSKSPARYEIRVDNHHHLICRACGEVIDVDCAKGKAPCMDPMDKHGYTIDEAEVIYWGICPSCQNHT